MAYPESYMNYSLPPPPPPVPAQSYGYGYADPNMYSHSQYSPQSYASITPGIVSVVNPPVPGHDAGMNYSCVVNPPVPGHDAAMNYSQPPPPEYSYELYEAPPPPPPPPPARISPHFAPPPPPPEPLPPPPPATQQIFRNEFRPQFEQRPRPLFDQRPRPQFDQRPRPQFDQRPRPQFDQRPRPLLDQRPATTPLFHQRSRPQSRPQNPQTVVERVARVSESNGTKSRFKSPGDPRFPQPRLTGRPSFPQNNNSSRSHGSPSPRFPVRYQNEYTSRVSRNPTTSSIDDVNFVSRFGRPGQTNGGNEKRNTGSSLLRPLLPSGTGIADKEKADNLQPLKPPPMPPVFNWSESDLKLPDSITELKVAQPDLPFIPEAVEKIDLVQIAQVMEKQEAENVGATISNLVEEGCIPATWPKELRELFQPLFCKLCVITLSSAVVAMAHYKGKKHKRKVDLWLADPRRKQFGGPTRPPAFQSVKPVFQPPISADCPISGSNATPLGSGFSKGGRDGPDRKKRNASEGVYNPTGASKYFPLGRPPKKLKTDPNSGVGFGFCELCKVSLTSQSNADDHYNGKPHAKKLQTTRKEGNFGEDPRFGIGRSFLKLNDENKSTPAPIPVQLPPQDDFIHQLPYIENNGFF